MLIRCLRNTFMLIIKKIIHFTENISLIFLDAVPASKGLTVSSKWASICFPVSSPTQYVALNQPTKWEWGGNIACNMLHRVKPPWARLIRPGIEPILVLLTRLNGAKLTAESCLRQPILNLSGCSPETHKIKQPENRKNVPFCLSYPGTVSFKLPGIILSISLFNIPALVLFKRVISDINQI